MTVSSLSFSIAKSLDSAIENITNNIQSQPSHVKINAIIKVTVLSAAAITGTAIVAVAEAVGNIALGILTSAAYFLTLSNAEFLGKISLEFFNRAVLSLTAILYSASSPFARLHEAQISAELVASFIQANAAITTRPIAQILIHNPAQHSRTEFQNWINNVIQINRESASSNQAEKLISFTMLLIILLREGLTTNGNYNELCMENVEKAINCIYSVRRNCPKTSQLQERFRNTGTLRQFLTEYLDNAIRNNILELSDLRSQLTRNESFSDINNDFNPIESSTPNSEFIIEDLTNGQELINALNTNPYKTQIYNLIIEQSDMNSAVRDILNAIQREAGHITLDQARQALTSSSAAPQTHSVPNLKDLLIAPNLQNQNYKQQISLYTKTAFRYAYRNIPEHFHTLNTTDPQTGAPVESTASIEAKKTSRESLISFEHHIFPMLAVIVSYLEISQGNTAITPAQHAAVLRAGFGNRAMGEIRNRLNTLTQREENILLLKLTSPSLATEFFESLPQDKKATINNLIKDIHTVKQHFLQTSRGNLNVKQYFTTAIVEVAQETEFSGS